jgi:hypothetical protein
MIESVRLNTLVEIGDRVNIEADNATYSAFVSDVADDGLTIEWREVEIMSVNGKYQESMITKKCFIDRENIKTITVIT